MNSRLHGFHWLSLAECWYNTNFHSSKQTTPFQALCGYPPPIHVPYLAGDATNPTLDNFLQDREATLQLLKFHLSRGSTQNESTSR